MQTSFLQLVRVRRAGRGNEEDKEDKTRFGLLFHLYAYHAYGICASLRHPSNSIKL